MTELAIVLDREEMSALGTQIIVERWDHVCGRGAGNRKKNLYRESFTESERRYISRLYKRAYRWYLVTGYPNRFVLSRPGEIQLIQRAVAFFAQF